MQLLGRATGAEEVGEILAMGSGGACKLREVTAQPGYLSPLASSSPALAAPQHLTCLPTIRSRAPGIQTSAHINRSKVTSPHV